MSILLYTTLPLRRRRRPRTSIAALFLRLSWSCGIGRPPIQQSVCKNRTSIHKRIKKWRDAAGCVRYFSLLLPLNFLDYFHSVLQPDVFLHYFLHVPTPSLLRCGDVASNPGPPQGSWREALKRDRSTSRQERRSRASSEDRETRLKKDRVGHAATRENETAIEQGSRQQKDRLAHVFTRGNETVQEREARLKKDREAHYPGDAVRAYVPPTATLCEHCPAIIFPAEKNLCCRGGNSLVTNFWPHLPTVQTEHMASAEQHNYLALLNDPTFVTNSRVVNNRCSLGILCVNGEGFQYGPLPACYSLYGKTYCNVRTNQWFISDPAIGKDSPCVQEQIHLWNAYFSRSNELYLSSSSCRGHLLPLDERVMKVRYGTGGCVEIALVASTVPKDRGCIYVQRDIKTSVPNTSGMYEPLMYPTLFENGRRGWDISDRRTHTLYDYTGRTIMQSQRHQIGGTVVQEWVLDMFSRWQEMNFNWMKRDEIITDHVSKRSEDNRQRLVTRGEWDKFSKNKDDPSRKKSEFIGRMYALPCSVMGSPLAQKKLIDDGMAVITCHGKPSYFVTMTANPKWPEVESMLRALGPGHTAKDHPEIVCRAFHLRKLDLLKRIRAGLFSLDGGSPCYIQSVVEFQKRGLPHAHIIFRVSGPQPTTSDVIDKFVSTKFASLEHSDPRLYGLLKDKMIHTCKTGRCRDSDDAPCRKRFPMKPCDETHIDERGYTVYQRDVGDEYVIPYNAFLLDTYECHINVLVCVGAHVVKYLRKYLCKPAVSTQVCFQDESVWDEWQRCRYVSYTEAIYRFLGFSINTCEPAVHVHSVHLPGQEKAILLHDREANDMMQMELGNLLPLRGKMPTFHSDMLDYFARPPDTPGWIFNSLKYLPYLQAYEVVRGPRKRTCDLFFTDMNKHVVEVRATRKPVVVRLFHVLSSNLELYSLKLLTGHKSARSFVDYRTVQGVCYDSFFLAANAAGLIDDDEHSHCFREYVSSGSTPGELRYYFCLLICQGASAATLFDAYFRELSDDTIYPRGTPSSLDERYIRNHVLKSLEIILMREGRQLSDFDLVLSDYDESIEDAAHLCQEALSRQLHLYPPQRCATSFREKYACMRTNVSQKYVVETIMDAVSTGTQAFLFVKAPAGRGKTFTVECALNGIRSLEKVGIPCAFMGNAASNYEGGTTCHKAFGLGFNSEETHQLSSVTSATIRGALIRISAVLFIDEISTLNVTLFDEIERVCRELGDSSKPFGGKSVVVCGDFRQLAPIVKNGDRSQILAATVVSSRHWELFSTVELEAHEHMRDGEDPNWSGFVDVVGDGLVAELDLAHTGCKIFTDPDEARAWCFQEVLNGQKTKKECAILSTYNQPLEQHNNAIIDGMPGILVEIEACEATHPDEANGVCSESFMRMYQDVGVPDHVIRIKKGATVHIVRNFMTEGGLLNGKKFIFVSATRYNMTLHHPSDPNAIVVLPRIKFNIDVDGLKFVRTQFPVKVSFATSVNKCQGKTLDRVLIDLRWPFFAHGQLYVALSRVRGSISIAFLTRVDEFGVPKTKVNNIVYDELIRI